MGLPSLTNALRFFESVFDQGTQILGVSALSLLELLVTIEVVFAGIYLALGNSADFKAIARKILLIGFFFWIITNYQSMLNTVVEGFLYAGLRGGASTNITFATLQDPDKIFQTGLNLLKPVVNKVFENASNSYLNLPNTDGLILLFCVVVSLISFGLIAIQVFITYLEYLLITAAGLILLPFGVFKPTAFLAERVFGAIIAFGIKLMILALVVGVSEQFLQTIIIPDEVTWRQGFEFVVISLALAFLAIHAPGVALSLLSGAPQLSFQTIAATSIGAGFAGAMAANQVSKSSTSSIRAATNLGANVIGASVAGASVARNSNTSGNKQSTSNFAGSSPVSGAIKGVVTGLASDTSEKFSFTNQNSAHSKRNVMLAKGINPDQKGIRGSYERGKFSVPAFRKQQLSDINNKEQSSLKKGIEGNE